MRTDKYDVVFGLSVIIKTLQCSGFLPYTLRICNNYVHIFHLTGVRVYQDDCPKSLEL
jgi:hypothetical protein